MKMIMLPTSIFTILLFMVVAPPTVTRVVNAGPPIPTRVACPANTPLIRPAGAIGFQSLASQEQAYVSTRAAKVLPGAWATYIRNVLLEGDNSRRRGIEELIQSDSFNTIASVALPRLGIAISGGGYRAALFGAGVLSSIDGRNATSAHVKGTGGLLQAASYISGLSGGSWLLTSLIQANFPTIPDLIFPPPPPNLSEEGTNAVFGGWLASTDLISPGPTANDTQRYIESIVSEVVPKAQAGFPITISDVWNRMINRHFVNGTTPANILLPGVHGSGILFSDVANVPTFTNHQQPFPIVVADSIPPTPDPAETIPGESVPLTSEIWEFNVFEAGSFDPSLASFIPTSLLGSPANSTTCVAGFDQAGYISGASSNLFNSFNVSAAALQASSVGPLIDLIQATFGNPFDVRLDSAAVPNSFQGVKPQTFSNANETMVQLCDGGSDGEVLPLQPLLVRARGIDTIFAIDAPSNTDDNFANGTDLINSKERAALFGDAYPFPPIPATPDIFVSQNLTRRPTFFGCDVDDGVTPLIIYIANGGPPANGAPPVTNTSTTLTTYSNAQVQAFLNQAFDIATQGIPGTDWGTCLSCGVFERARARLGLPRDATCEACLQQYCWSG